MADDSKGKGVSLAKFVRFFEAEAHSAAPPLEARAATAPPGPQGQAAAGMAGAAGKAAEVSLERARVQRAARVRRGKLAAATCKAREGHAFRTAVASRVDRAWPS